MNQADIEKKLEELRLIGMAAMRQPIRQPRSSRDPYSDRMQAALRQINHPDYLAGMILWLSEAQPDLYEELTSHIPDEIDLAWQCRAPLAEFDAILTRLVSIHREACRIYREYLAARTEPIALQKSDQRDSGTPTGNGGAQ